jgi:hypothetical protein
MIVHQLDHGNDMKSYFTKESIELINKSQPLGNVDD